MTSPAVTVVSKQPFPCGTMRTRLSNGWFIDGAASRAHQHYNYKYSLWEPGAGPRVIAAFRGGADTFKAALAIAQGVRSHD